MQTVPPNPPAQTTQAEQNTEIRLYLIALELVSDGKCSSYGPRLAAGESQAIGPSGDSNPAFLRLRNSYTTARNWGERQDVIDQARIEVLALKRTAPLHVVGETRKELEARMLEEAEDLTPQQVTSTKQFAAFTARQVTSARIRDSRDPDTGRKVEEPIPLVDQELHQEIRRLKTVGRTERQIAMLTGATKGTIYRALKAAA